MSRIHGPTAMVFAIGPANKQAVASAAREAHSAK